MVNSSLKIKDDSDNSSYTVTSLLVLLEVSSGVGDFWGVSIVLFSNSVDSTSDLEESLDDVV